MPETTESIPFFSIVVPCYNHGHFLAEAVESVLHQEFKDWELIIVNDGSTDDTEQIAQSYAMSDPRIKVITQANAGLSAARNTGIQAGRGKYFHFLDADDGIKPGCYQTVMTYTGHADIVVSGYSYFRKEGIFHTYAFEQTLVPLERLFSLNVAPPVAFFVSREIVNRVGTFDTGLKSCEDWDFWIRAAKAGARIQTIKEVLVLYQYVADSMSRDPFRMYEALKEVSLRAPRKDERLNGDFPLNRDYQADMPEILKHQLFRCLGVSIMQGKIRESVDWFNIERKGWKWNYSVQDFGTMSSYLSFRYFLKKEEIRHLLLAVKPLFRQFFIAIGLDDPTIELALKVVFQHQLKRRNHYRYGKYIGALVNRLTFS